jgi:ParB/RepB/Spo0J family partition protein
MVDNHPIRTHNWKFPEPALEPEEIDEATQEAIVDVVLNVYKEKRDGYSAATTTRVTPHSPRGELEPKGAVIMEYLEIPLESIKVGPYNLRGEKAAEKSPSLERLSTSICKEGLLHALGVIDNGDGTYTLVYGHRRYWSIAHYLKEAMPVLPVRIISKAEADEVTAIRIALAENNPNLRRNLNPIALAKKLRALRDNGLNNRELADAVGFEKAGSVTDVIKLLQLEPEVQDALITGQLTRGYGSALLPLKGNREQQLQALAGLQKLSKEERSVRRAEKIVRSIQTGSGWYQLSLELPEAANVQELPKDQHKLTIVFGNVTELRYALTYILEHNTDLSLQYINPSQKTDTQSS